MSNLVIISEAEKVGIEIGKLDYGTFVTDVPNGKGSVYVKVKKQSTNNKLSMQWTSGSCVLMNLKYGTLREVVGMTFVTPLRPKLTVSVLPETSYHEVTFAQYAEE